MKHKQFAIKNPSPLFEANSAAVAVAMIMQRRWRSTVSRVMALLLDAPGLYLESGCRVIGGRHVSFGRGVYANRDLWLQAVTQYRSQRFNPVITIGDRVVFSNCVHIAAIESIVIGSNVAIGGKTLITDHNHGIYNGDEQSSPEEAPMERPLGKSGPVTIGDNVFIGDNSLILGPASIGSGSMIGAGSVVRGIIPPNCIAAGAPAKVIKVFNPHTGTWDRV